jgi:hypothetical protein
LKNRNAKPPAAAKASNKLKFERKKKSEPINDDLPEDCELPPFYP